MEIYFEVMSSNVSWAPAVLVYSGLEDIMVWGSEIPISPRESEAQPHSFETME